MKKQETLEEAAERMSIDIREEDYKDGFIEGAKWQAERSYSEEEVLALNLKYAQGLGKETGHWLTFANWFEQFKKK